MKCYAVYRCLYGEDFVQESINSITDYVDKIFVFWTDKVWGHAKGCIYKNQPVVFPKKFDSVVDKIRELNNPKIILSKQTPQMNPGSVPWNLYTVLVNNYVLPDYKRPNIIILPELDHVFRDDQINGALIEFKESKLVTARTRQIELWKTPKYRIAERRNRIGVVFWNLDLVANLSVTKGNGQVPGTPELSHYVHNFGFAVSEKVMYWKHMTALGFSKVIKDCQPNEGWLDKWLTWDPETNNKDLEISRGYEHTISHAFKYDPAGLPELIREKYSL